jgi:hypothetical protein
LLRERLTSMPLIADSIETILLLIVSWQQCNQTLQFFSISVNEASFPGTLLSVVTCAETSAGDLLFHRAYCRSMNAGLFILTQ